MIKEKVVVVENEAVEIEVVMVLIEETVEVEEEVIWVDPYSVLVFCNFLPTPTADEKLILFFLHKIA